MFEVGEVYNRRPDIHGPYGGQQQGGISTPRGWPFVFLFTGESGEQYGYEDGWDDNGVFLYTGEGQVGVMGFVRGNQAIRDHAVSLYHQRSARVRAYWPGRTAPASPAGTLPPSAGKTGPPTWSPTTPGGCPTADRTTPDGSVRSAPTAKRDRVRGIPCEP